MSVATQNKITRSRAVRLLAMLSEVGGFDLAFASIDAHKSLAEQSVVGCHLLHLCGYRFAVTVCFKCLDGLTLLLRKQNAQDRIPSGADPSVTREDT
jgi:hypothetical protein